MANKAAFVVGDRFQSKNYGPFEVLERLVGKAVVRFIDTGFVCTVDKKYVLNGSIKDPLVRNVHNVGYYGDRTFTKTLSAELVSAASQCWRDMMDRCYEGKYPSYINCYVNDYWHDFQNFAKFYIECPYRQTGWQLDKDILVKGNKEYGPDTCCFVPVDINGYMKTNSNRRGDYPIGVKLSYLRNSYESRVRDFDGKQILLGKYATPELAFEAYKSTKENVIKQKAEFWKDQICPKVYHALLNFKVDITD